jgi:hypothetical protein
MSREFLNWDMEQQYVFVLVCVAGAKKVMISDDLLSKGV